MYDVHVHWIFLPIKCADLPPRVTLLCHENVSICVYPKISYSVVLYNCIQSLNWNTEDSAGQKASAHRSPGQLGWYYCQNNEDIRDTETAFSASVSKRAAKRQNQGGDSEQDGIRDLLIMNGCCCCLFRYTSRPALGLSPRAVALLGVAEAWSFHTLHRPMQLYPHLHFSHRVDHVLVSPVNPFVHWPQSQHHCCSAPASKSLEVISVQP